MNTGQSTLSPQQIAADIAAELRANPDHWMQGALLKQADGLLVTYPKTDEELRGAVCWCLEGHIARRTGMDDSCRVFEAFRDVAEAGDGLYRWNDAEDRTVDEVIALCDQVARS